MPLKAKNSANTRRFMLTGFASAVVALLLALLAAQSSPFRNASLALQDMQVAATTGPLNYDDVMDNYFD